MASVFNHQRSGGKLSVSVGETGNLVYIEITDCVGSSSGTFLIDLRNKVESFELIIRKSKEPMLITMECLYFFLFECLEMEII